MANVGTLASSEAVKRLRNSRWPTSHAGCHDRRTISGGLSRSDGLTRLCGMELTPVTNQRWLTLIVAAHLVVSLAHGGTHQWGHVPLSPAATLFVFIVILAGPLVGVAVMRVAERAGHWIIATTLAAAFVFGVVNHFLVPGTDHVSHVSGGAQLWFAVTAVLLAVTEAIGCVLAALLARSPTTPDEPRPRRS